MHTGKQRRRKHKRPLPSPGRYSRDNEAYESQDGGTAARHSYIDALGKGLGFYLVTPREVGPNSQVSKAASNSPVTPSREAHSNPGAI